MTQKEIIADLMEFVDEINRHRKKPGPIDWAHALRLLGLDAVEPIRAQE